MFRIRLCCSLLSSSDLRKNIILVFFFFRVLSSFLLNCKFLFLRYLTSLTKRSKAPRRARLMHRSSLYLGYRRLVLPRMATAERLEAPSSSCRSFANTSDKLKLCSSWDLCPHRTLRRTQRSNALRHARWMHRSSLSHGYHRLVLPRMATAERLSSFHPYI